MRRLPVLLSRMLVCLAFAAMLARAVMPDGWMVRQDAESRQLVIETCHGRSVIWPASAAGRTSGERSRSLWTWHEPDTGGDLPDGEPAQPACPVAMSSVLAPGSQPLLLLEPHRPAAPSFTAVATAELPVLRIMGARQPPRGPPSSV